MPEKSGNGKVRDYRAIIGTCVGIIIIVFLSMFGWLASATEKLHEEKVDKQIYIEDKRNVREDIKEVKQDIKDLRGEMKDDMNEIKDLIKDIDK